jgi:hypothetical protein
MILLKQQATEQIIKFIPTRDGVPNELFLRNETTNVQTNQYIDCTTESFYLKFNEVLDLKEGHFYTLTIKENQKKKEIDNFGARVVADEGEYEAETCLYTFLDLFDFNSIVVHNDKVFVTNQNTESYSVNKDEYIKHSENIIFYE